MSLSKKQIEVKRWGMQYLKGRSVYCPILKGKVYFNKEGIRHSLYYKPNKLKLKVFKNIEQYIPMANERLVELNKHNPQLKIYKLSLYATIDKHKYHIYIVVKENNMGKYYYDSGIIKKV